MQVTAKTNCPTVVRNSLLPDSSERPSWVHWQRQGQARRRRLRRQKWISHLGGVVRLLTTLWLMLGAFLPAIFYGYTNSWDIETPLAYFERLDNSKTSNIAFSILQPSPTSFPETPIPTVTSSPTPTATPTATPLPLRLVQATAWQATLDQAAAFSHATQTLAASQYAATQTSLPPILTVNALDRAATATAGAK